MAIPGWQKAESPFHIGEQEIQRKLGAREQMESFGRRVIRDFLPQQHQQFYAQLSYLLVGSVDASANPWASILIGTPGFISALGDRALHISAQPLFGDPLGQTLAVGIDVGFLGIELHTRRRNRVNGVVRAVSDNGFEVQVGQAFGNCPKYIQQRHCDLSGFDPAQPKTVRHLTGLAEVHRKLIAGADTFFIATAYLEASAGAARGVDVSHRGGKAGFVRMDGDTLTVPDFAGNCHFNTFGNIELNPKAGLLFLDFAEGDLLYLTGGAEVVWEGAEIERYAGAERLFRFHLTEGYHVSAALPAGWTLPEFSPFLEETGDWA